MTRKELEQLIGLLKKYQDLGHYPLPAELETMIYEVAFDIKYYYFQENIFRGLLKTLGISN